MLVDRFKRFGAKRRPAHIDSLLRQLPASDTIKMASLGELTVGIAHEIQNPLNFVNNFSEVSIELLQELREEVLAGDTADVLAISDDLTQNLDKLHQHGKRADSIVKRYARTQPDRVRHKRINGPQ